jgi:hypothetical protein
MLKDYIEAPFNGSELLTDDFIGQLQGGCIDN